MGIPINVLVWTSNIYNYDVIIPGSNKYLWLVVTRGRVKPGNTAGLCGVGSNLRGLSSGRRAEHMETTLAFAHAKLGLYFRLFAIIESV